MNIVFFIVFWVSFLPTCAQHCRHRKCLMMILACIGTAESRPHQTEDCKVFENSWAGRESAFLQLCLTIALVEVDMTRKGSSQSSQEDRMVLQARWWSSTRTMVSGVTLEEEDVQMAHHSKFSDSRCAALFGH